MSHRPYCRCQTYSRSLLPFCDRHRTSAGFSPGYTESVICVWRSRVEPVAPEKEGVVSQLDPVAFNIGRASEQAASHRIHAPEKPEERIRIPE